jgi:GNAT superfamily N-acetyltransferase
MQTVPPLATTRRATLDDLDTLLANVQSGFDSYVAFAERGWQPPNSAAGRVRTAELLADPATWGLIALVDRSPIGHVAFFPAREQPVGGSLDAWNLRAPVPGLAHLWQLFVLPEWWGRGIGPLLHDAMITEMSAQGYRGARLFTPSLHTRARRFYERRRWLVVAEEWNNGLSLMLTEYRLAIPARL